jgi:hypothetical protein
MSRYAAVWRASLAAGGRCAIVRKKVFIVSDREPGSRHQGAYPGLMVSRSYGRAAIWQLSCACRLRAGTWLLLFWIWPHLRPRRPIFSPSIAILPDYRRHSAHGSLRQRFRWPQEQRCLELGAWDFVSRSRPQAVIRRRIVNMIRHSTLPFVETLEADVRICACLLHLQQTALLRGRTRHDRRESQAALCVFLPGLEKFRLINSFFGQPEGDRVIRFIAQLLREFSSGRELFTYGDMGAAVFAFCMAFDDRA